VIVPGAEIERALWASGQARVAGVDEVGRGSWAGPVVAAAVVFSPEALRDDALRGVRDSKTLSAAAREELAARIRAVACGVGVGAASSRVVDSLGLTRATVLAMCRAIARLRPAPDYLLVDGLPIRGIDLPHRCIVDGDALCLSIAAASIVAKVARDRWMARWDARFPAYAFAQNKGYGTPAHRRALATEGPCPLHRLSYAPVAARRLPFEEFAGEPAVGSL
jgi:ribonuclease HII